jgi:hypothetical protein
MTDEKSTPVQTEETESTMAQDAPPVSAFATLTRGQCVRKFWRLYLGGLGACVAGM